LFDSNYVAKLMSYVMSKRASGVRCKWVRVAFHRGVAWRRL